MKKRFLPLSLLLVIMMLGQSITFADNGGHYVPRVQGSATADSYMSELRANQHTGLIDPALMIKAAQGLNNVKGSENDPLYWISMGPDNMGGQTTAILYDNTKNAFGHPNGVVYIGSKGGGVYKTYNHGITWHQVGGLNLMVSCMAQDADGVIYVGTGDCGAAATYNGLEQQSYENSFVGGGVYKIVNDEMTQISSTAPAQNNVGDWSFVNDLIVIGNKLIAATEGGLKYSTDKGATWTLAKDADGVELNGSAMQVKAMGNSILAAVDGKVYTGELNAMVCHSADEIQYDANQAISAIPTAAGLLDIAVAPSDNNVIYASCVGTDGVHKGIYVSENQGATWEIAQPSSQANYGHNLYAGYGLNNHGLVVNPNDANVLYILGYELWELVKPENAVGYYLSIRLSNGEETDYTSPNYLHVGLHSMVFNPNNDNEFYIGTDGGIFKGLMGEAMTFTNCNRNYVTTRMFNVAYSNTVKRVMGAALDHGTVMIEGNGNVNHEQTASWVYSAWVNNSAFGSFDQGWQPGPCAFSMINPNTIFVTKKDGGIARSETAGADWVSTNFTESLSPGISSTSFRMPIYLYENFNDQLNHDTVWAFNETNQAVTEVQAISKTGYPFNATLSTPLAAGDSVLVHDPISARLYFCYKNYFYMTRGALDFATAPKWFLLSNKDTEFKGEPLCMGSTADGDNMFVGFKDGRFVRISNLNTVVDDASGSLSDTTGSFQVTTTLIELPIDGQCITSVSVDPRNANNVVVTLGNYGNDSYVLYSTNALAENPTFASKQTNLPKMPVYSSMIEMTTGYVILGTEHGIYMAEDIANPQWVAQNTAMGDVPVMDLKQQIMTHPDQVISHPYGDEIVPGVHNQGMIYAATYGRGLFRCENFRLEEFASVEDAPVVETSISMYPNPVQDMAKVSFEVKGNANVNCIVYDICGRVVMSQSFGTFNEGNHEVNVDMSGLSSGAYILRLNQGAVNSTVKFMVY